MAVKRLGILTGGGDAPGLNAAIRAVVKVADRAGVACVGLEEGFEGLLNMDRAQPLTLERVRGIHRLGGTVLGTTNRGNPLSPRGIPGIDPPSYAAALVENFHKLDLDALIVMGGDGTLAIAGRLAALGLPLVVIPKTIDHDVAETSVTIGFDSAVACVTGAIDRLQTTADAHRRIMVVQVMGRYTGWIAIHGGIAGGADVILLPEIPFDLERVADHIRERQRRGAHYHMVVVAEGAFPAGGARAVAAPGGPGREERLGGIGERLAAELETRTEHEARFEVLGHLQRGGTPTSADRVVAAKLGAFAVDLALRQQFGVMTAEVAGGLIAVPIERVVGRTQTLPLDHELIRTARSLGICLGG